MPYQQLRRYFNQWTPIAPEEWDDFTQKLRVIHKASGAQFLKEGQVCDFVCYINQGLVRAFKPYHRIAWTAKGTGLLAYHAWLITPSDQGYTVITEETQQGWLPWLGKRFIQKSLYNQHQRWLEGLKEKAESMHS